MHSECVFFRKTTSYSAFYVFCDMLVYNFNLSSVILKKEKKEKKNVPSVRAAHGAFTELSVEPQLPDKRLDTSLH